MQGAGYQDLGRKAIEAYFRKLDGMHVDVGVVGARRYKDVRGRRGRIRRARGPATVADVLWFHEKGTVDMAARPTMRPAFHENIDTNRSLILSGVKAAIRSRGLVSPSAMPKRLGVRHAGAIQKQIRNLRSPALKDSTKRKRFYATGDANPNPLIDTGQLVQSITSLVRRNGSEVGA